MEDKINPSSSDAFSENEAFEEPSFPFQEKLHTLEVLLKRVANPTWAVSPEDIFFLTLDLGLVLSESSEQTRLNPEVFEDPLNRGDALGNVLMISKKQSRQDTGLLREFGEHLLELTHLYQQRFRKEISNQGKLKELLPELERNQIDDVEAEDILAAKKKIVELRRENYKLDRRNESLWIQLQKSKEDRHLSTSSSPNESSERHTTKICTVRESGKPNSSSRKRKDSALNVDSQVDFSW